MPSTVAVRKVPVRLPGAPVSQQGSLAQIYAGVPNARM